jgi:hypothetical protein
MEESIDEGRRIEESFAKGLLEGVPPGGPNGTG